MKSEMTFQIMPTVKLNVKQCRSSNFFGSLSTVVGDEKLTSREDQIGLLFLYIQSDENTLPKVDKIFKTEAQTFNIFDKLIGPLQFCI